MRHSGVDHIGDEAYGATNEQFSGAYAEYALPIVTLTAWQMLFEYASVTADQTVLVHGAAGNLGGLCCTTGQMGLDYV